MFASAFVGSPAIVERVRVRRIETYGFGEVGDGLVVFTFGGVGIPAVVERDWVARIKTYTLRGVGDG